MMIGIQEEEYISEGDDELLVMGFGGYLRDRKMSSKQLIIQVRNAVVSGRKLEWHVKITVLNSTNIY